MPSAAFEKSIPFILRWEGGFVDHPNDPGGRTNKGVTQKVYDQWRARQGQAPQDVKLIDDSEVHAIYESGYWLPPRCDLLQSPLDLVQFDTAVNMGVGRAVRLLQRCVGCEPDGDFGPNSKEAVATCDCGNTASAYCDAREAYYRQLAAAKPRGTPAPKEESDSSVRTDSVSAWEWFADRCVLLVRRIRRAGRRTPSAACRSGYRPRTHTGSPRSRLRDEHKGARQREAQPCHRSLRCNVSAFVGSDGLRLVRGRRISRKGGSSAPWRGRGNAEPEC